MTNDNKPTYEDIVKEAASWKGEDISAEVFGKYQNCTMGPDGRWYSDLDFINGQLQPGSIPAAIYEGIAPPPYKPTLLARIKYLLTRWT